MVIPALNAAGCLDATLRSVAEADEIVVADGGSWDGTVAAARKNGARVVIVPRGRGRQIGAGVVAAGGDWLLLLHADTQMTPGWREAAGRFMAQGPERAGYFRFSLDSADPRARRLERLVAWRCRRLGLPYGDQGLLIARQLLDGVGGMRPFPLMEDVDLVRRIGRARLCPIPIDAVTSAARWERDGWVWRSARNLFCLALWRAGVPPSIIAKVYR